MLKLLLRGIVNISILKDKGKRVLVTGATGMVGSRLALDLILRGNKVRAIFRSKESIRNFISNIGFYNSDSQKIVDEIEWVEGDMTDYSSILKAVEDIDIVYHCAALVSFNPDDFISLKEINIAGTSNIIDACLLQGVKRVCHVSSIAALGRYEAGITVNEESSFIPGKRHSGYSLSKFHSEMEVWRGIYEGLEAVIVNPSVVLSPGSWGKGNADFFDSIKKGFKFYPPGSTGFVDVRDVSEAIVMMTDDDNWQKCMYQRFLLSSQNLSYRDFFSKVAKSINVKAPNIKVSKNILEIFWRVVWLFSKISGRKPVITKENAQTSVRKSIYDGTKITRIIGFEYRNIDDTIAEIGELYLKSNRKLKRGTD